MASAISMLQASWLLLSGSSTVAQQSMQELPFDGQALFAEQTDTKLHGLKDSCTTLKMLGRYVPGPARKGVERKYFVPSKGYAYLYTNPQPCSLVVAMVNKRERQGQQGPTPKSKESMRLDLLGCKVYSTRGLKLRIANHQVIPSRYSFNSWNSMLKFRVLVPAESREEFGAIVEAGKAVVRISLQASLDAADVVAYTLSSDITMRHSSWLQASGLPTKVQQTLQDLPFDGVGLFAEQTDSRLHSLKTLGLH
ncbi:hypothetical protein UY3_13301 [Chelonia mydas]|uniref:Uncharacterized protein n=1 Tax=Chelonia mydas TaxID=8469 RepID=M7BN09_CHEMY|nr:hypothetical protein UY3_13301 [Chelonia mydas]